MYSVHVIIHIHNSHINVHVQIDTLQFDIWNDCADRNILILCKQQFSIVHSFAGSKELLYIDVETVLD